MSRLLLPLLLAGGVLLNAGLPPAQRSLPDVAVPLPDGKKIDLKQYRGKALVLAIVSTDCAPCGIVTDLLKKFQSEYGPQGLQVVAAVVEKDGASHLAGFTAQHKPNYPIGSLELDPYFKITRAKTNTRTEVPILLFVDPQGGVRVQLFGDDPLMKNPELIVRGTVRELVKEVKK